MKTDDEMSADSDAVVMTPSVNRPQSAQAVSWVEKLNSSLRMNMMFLCVHSISVTSFLLVNKFAYNL